MNELPLFGVSVLMSFVAFGIVTRIYIWPRLRVFNVWGAADLLVAFYQGLLGVRIDPASLGAAYFVPTVVVPPLLVTHGLMFWLLLRKPASAAPKLGRQSISWDVQ